MRKSLNKNKTLQKKGGKRVGRLRKCDRLTQSNSNQCAQVNGVKKWITEGAYADYFVTAVRTGGPGGKGQVLSG